MFAVQQQFAVKTVQVNKINKQCKASFVQDMKKVRNTIRLSITLKKEEGRSEFCFGASSSSVLRESESARVFVL